MSDNLCHSRKDAASAYARGAQIIIGESPEHLNQYRALVPVVVSNLYQSIEISIKYAGVESGVLQESEIRGFRSNPLPQHLQHNGHDIDLLLGAIDHRLEMDGSGAGVCAIQICAGDLVGRELIRTMLTDSRLKSTRDAYCSRRLGYVEIESKEVSFPTALPAWSAATICVAESIDGAVAALKELSGTPLEKRKHTLARIRTNVAQRA